MADIIPKNLSLSLLQLHVAVSKHKKLCIVQLITLCFKTLAASFLLMSAYYFALSWLYVTHSFATTVMVT